MWCIHGLDEINCPTCRILKFTVPKDLLSIKKAPYLHIENPFFKKNVRLNDKISKEMIPNKLNGFNPTLQKPPLINEIPDFQNKIFLERLRELDLSKDNLFGLSKKIQLDSSEWKFDE